MGLVKVKVTMAVAGAGTISPEKFMKFPIVIEGLAACRLRELPISVTTSTFFVLSLPWVSMSPDQEDLKLHVPTESGVNLIL